MIWGIIVWGFFLVAGIVASFWNWAHIYFTALPSAWLLIVSIIEYRREKQRKNTYK